MFNLWPETLFPRILLGRFFRPESTHEDDTGFRATRVLSLPEGIPVMAVCAAVSVPSVNALASSAFLQSNSSVNGVSAKSTVGTVAAAVSVSGVKSSAKALVTGP